ncbi:hypothetical protein QUB80_31535 [Chlorogloeopsis sp. ULAP01]|uniref:hypothetical protein n=1 Tax=Chlorogloeopsis sp. ULAP01 TaxID=3056483 RepID=UPI0025AAA007|nr:hypothetical protein [Chlorogloeopsis sp. ULAP01]MDM9385188.1 hypothetical protein [Chlorogloeopsis sp. ULAP01]
MVVSVVVFVLASVAVELGEEVLEAACCVEHPAVIKLTTITSTTKNSEIFNRIASYRLNQSILASVSVSNTVKDIAFWQ